MVWNPLEKPVDHIVLGGWKSPGLAEVTGGASPLKWDERGGYGLSGSTLIFRGVGLVKFTVKLRLYTPEDWAGWQAWRPLVSKPPLGSKAKAMDFIHPLTEALGVSAVVVEEVSQPEQTDNGEWTITIKFIEHRKPTPALAKPEGSRATPVDPIEMHVIQPLLNQYSALATE
jgi:hypothetical protein